jgi:hypothetical protein
MRRSWFFEYHGMVIDAEYAKSTSPSDVYIVQLWNKPQIVRIPRCHLKIYEPFYLEENNPFPAQKKQVPGS